MLQHSGACGAKSSTRRDVDGSSTSSSSDEETSPTHIRQYGRRVCKRDTPAIDLQGIAARESFATMETMD